MKPQEGYVDIPKGYLWCQECDALTPHEKSNDISFSWQEDYRTCVICESVIIFDDSDCPKCGWRYINYENPREHTIQVHHLGCHYNEVNRDEEDITYSFGYSHAESVWNEFIRYNFQFKDIEEIKCDCPEYKVYPDPYCYNSDGGYGPGMICYNERWWILYIRCPICGERFEIEDGNC